MAELPGIVITGASGRMGRILLAEVAASGRARLLGALVRPGHAWIGQDAGTAAGGAPIGVTVTDDPLSAFAHAQAVIDFTTPAATVAFAGLAAQARCVHVIGTTGLSDADIAAIGRAAHHAVIVRAGNMSLGVNLLVGLARRVAAALDQDWDIEIVEAHHRRKVDAPSGTALMLGQAAAEGRGVALDAVRQAARDGLTGARGRRNWLLGGARRRHRGRARRDLRRNGRADRAASRGDRPRDLRAGRAACGPVGAGQKARRL